MEPFVNVLTLTRFEIFMQQYENQLQIAVRDYPGEYTYSALEIPAVVSRMKAAFQKGSFNKEGRAIKGTCKTLGIPYTYKGISEYIKAGA